MTKRITALMICLAMMLSVASFTVSAKQDENGKRYIDSGSLQFGTATLYTENALPVEVKFAYARRISISEAIYAQLSKIFGEAGLGEAELEYDYQQFGNQSFFVMSVDDKDAIGRILSASDSDAPEEVIVSDASPSDVSASDVSGSDISGGDAAPSDQETPAEEKKDDKSDKKDKKDDDKSDFEVDEKKDLTVLEMLAENGSVSCEVKESLKESFVAALPDFTFEDPMPAYLGSYLDASSDAVTLSDDKTSATIDIYPEPEYIEREIYGEKFTVIMMSNEAYRYSVHKYDVTGTKGNAAKPEPEPEPQPQPEPEPTQPTEPTTTTTALVTTTTAPTTTTTMATTTTTVPTTTMTTAPTTAPTQPPQPGTGRGYVSTRWKRLRLRQGPGFEYDIITMMPKGTQFTLLSTDNPQWYKIRLDNGLEGYAWSGYLTVN